MPLPAIVVSIIISVSITVVATGISLAIAYLNRPKTKKSIFESGTYHENGMINNIQPGTPKNIIYGEHLIPPTIINKYSFAMSDEHGEDNHTKTEILCSLGEETTGVWGIKVNDQSITSAYPDGKGLKMWWAPGGRTNQLIYEKRNVKSGTISASITAGFNKTINFDYDSGDNSSPFQGRSSNEDSPTVSDTKPGYVLIYEKDNKYSYEVVRYEGIAAYGGIWQLTGCLITKDHAIDSIIRQEWQLAYKEDGVTPLTIMPPFGKNVIEQQDLSGGEGLLIDYNDGWSSVITTNNKVRAFAVTIGFEKGLYGLDTEDGYKSKSCGYQIAWRKEGASSWETTYDWTPKTLHDSTDSGLKLIITKKQNYAYVVNADGTYFLDFKGNFGSHGLEKVTLSNNKKDRRYRLNFTSTKEGAAYDWSLPLSVKKGIKFEYEADTDGGNYYNDVTGNWENKYRCKITFNTKKGKYTGNTISASSPVNFTITYEKGVANNLVEEEASPSQAVISSYRLTTLIPANEPLDYAKYEIRVKKLDIDIDDAEDGQNEMRWLTLQELDNDAIEYPYESLLGLRLKMNESINTVIESITCMTQGKAITDVQQASNVWAASTAMSVGQFMRPVIWDNTLYRVRSITGDNKTGVSEPIWLDIGVIVDGNVTWEIANRYSSNPLDIAADIIMSKRYGRGKYLELTNDRITAFYDKFSTEAAFADEAITEDNSAKKRFSLNLNLDFRGPLIDLLQSLGNTFRGKFYFDGEIPVCYIDRKKTPTAMFCTANIVEDSYKPEALNLSDNINRIQAQFLNLSKKYVQDTTEIDIVAINSSWTVGKLQDKIISLYGLTRKWHVKKIITYMLRFAWYTRNSTSFQTTLDGLSCDIGDTFYCHDDTMNLTAQSGRILVVGSNYIDMDKAFTFVVATTYKALLRKDNGQPHSELTVDLTATGTGAQTRVYFTSSISSVSTNSIYILGTGTYYMTFRCVQKGFKGNAIDFGALEYNEEIYRIYKNDTSDPALTGETEEITNEEDTVLMSGDIVPPEIEQMVLGESTTNYGEVEVHTRVPLGDLSWDHANIYYREGDGEWVDAGQTKGEIIKISNLVVGNEYDFKAISVSPSGITNFNPVTATLTLDGVSDIFIPDPVTGIQLVGNKGTETNVSGSDFNIQWDASSKIYGDSANNLYENIKYVISVYFSDIPSSVKHGSVEVRDKLAYTETITENNFSFTLAKNIEASKDLWEDYSTDANYDTYYGNPQRVCKLVIQALNGYNNLSEDSEIILTNPAPDMLDDTGATITPTLKKIKSGLKIKWTHPYQEYDISHFVVKVASDSGFTTIVDRSLVTSVITIDSSDDDISLAKYKTEVVNLDPKVTYYVKIIPHDVFGKGIESNTASKSAGLTDSDEDDIVRPVTPNLPTLTYEYDEDDDGKTVTDLKIKWDKNTEIDIDGYYLEYRAVKNIAATTPPTADELDTGITVTGSYKCYGDVKEVSLDGESGTGNLEKTTVTRRLKSVKNRFTYFVRLRAQNTAGNKSENWTDWAYLAATKGNNAIDSDAPSNPTVNVVAYGDSLETTATISSPPTDLAGFQFSVKSSAFTDDSDRLTYKHSTIDSSDGKAVSIFSGDVGTAYYVSVRAYDNSDNYSAWVDYAANPVIISGITSANLSETYKKFQYKGELSSSAYNKISWTAANLKFKNGDTYAITAATNSTVTSTMVVAWSKNVSSGTVFTLVDYDTYYLSATYDDYTAIALVEVNSDTGSEATIIPFESTDYNITASMLTASRLIVSSAQLGDLVVTSAKINTLVADKITGGTITGQTILLGTGGKFATASSGARVELDSTGIKAYDATSQRIQILSDGSGWLGESSSFSWTTGGVVTMNADSITTGTLTGRTIQTASGTGQRVILSNTVNEMQVYNSSNVLVASVGVIGGDLILVNLGHATYAGLAIKAETSHSTPTIQAKNNGSGIGVEIIAEGDALRASSSAGCSAVFNANATRGNYNVAPNAGKPSSPAKGDHCFDHTPGTNKEYCYDGTYWQQLWLGTHFMVLSSDFVGSNVNTDQPVFNATTNGTITLLAAKTYELDAQYIITRSAGTTAHNLGLSFGGTNTLTSIMYTAAVSTLISSGLAAVNIIHSTTRVNTLITASISDATEYITVRIKGMIRTGTAGTFIPQVIYNVAPGGAPTFLANSFIKLTPLGSNTITYEGNWS